MDLLWSFAPAIFLKWELGDFNSVPSHQTAKHGYSLGSFPRSLNLQFVMVHYSNISKNKNCCNSLSWPMNTDLVYSWLHQIWVNMHLKSLCISLQATLHHANHKMCASRTPWEDLQISVCVCVIFWLIWCTHHLISGDHFLQDFRQQALGLHDGVLISEVKQQNRAAVRPDEAWRER